MNGELDYEKKIEKAGCFWRYDSLKDNPINLQFTFSKKYDQSKLIHIFISDMGLYLFRSGVGFLWYEIEADNESLRDSVSLIKFQNMIKELDRGYNNHLWINSCDVSSPDEFEAGTIIPFMLGNWVAERLKFLNVKFQAERTNSYAGLIGDYYFGSYDKKEKKRRLNKLYSELPKYCPDKALIFTYAAFERKHDWKIDNNAIRTAYYLTNGYKDTYEMSESVSDTIKRPFSNVIWMASKEGCGYFAWQGDQNGTFFYKTNMQR